MSGFSAIDRFSTNTPSVTQVDEGTLCVPDERLLEYEMFEQASVDAVGETKVSPVLEASRAELEDFIDKILNTGDELEIDLVAPVTLYRNATPPPEQNLPFVTSSTPSNVDAATQSLPNRAPQVKSSEERVIAAAAARQRRRELRRARAERRDLKPNSSIQKCSQASVLNIASKDPRIRNREAVRRCREKAASRRKRLEDEECELEAENARMRAVLSELETWVY